MPQSDFILFETSRPVFRVVIIEKKGGGVYE